MKRKYRNYEKWSNIKLERVIRKVDRESQKREEKTERQKRRIRLKGHRNKKNNINACIPHTPKYKEEGLML